MTASLILVPGHLVDGTGAPSRQDVAVVVERQTIVDVLSVDALPDGTSARRILLPDATLLPGLIDSHVHLTLGDGPTPRETMMREDNQMLLLRAASQARGALVAGITTVRDCGGRDDVTFVLRDAIQKGVTPGPRLLLCGSPLTPPRGHCYFMHGEVNDRNDIADRIASLARRGADFIKVMATGGGLTPGTDSLALQFNPEDLSFIVDEASRHGLPVSAHAHSDQAIRACIHAGVSTIEHATFVSRTGIDVDEEILRLMAGRSTVVVPTVVPAENAVRAGRTLGLAREIGMSSADFVVARREVLGAMVRVGVRLIAGSDAGATGVGFTDVLGEVMMLAEIGMSHEQAVAAATGTTAEALGMQRVGRIAPGYLADLLAVRGDLSADLDVLYHPVLVVLGGEIVLEEGI
jgi:imidazolonepropionase-like amidohydrolase